MVYTKTADRFLKDTISGVQLHHKRFSPGFYKVGEMNKQDSLEIKDVSHGQPKPMSSIYFLCISTKKMLKNHVPIP